MYSGLSAVITTRGVWSGEPPSELTRIGFRSGKYWTIPAVAARTTKPIVSALPKLGMPTIRSACPTRRTSAEPARVERRPGSAVGLDVRTGLLGRSSSRCSLGCPSVARVPARPVRNSGSEG